jgi:imidazolonepropionase-like amidohydrolase
VAGPLCTRRWYEALVVLDDAGRIEFAGPAGHPVAPEISGLLPEQCLEVGGGTVLPELIDSHVHLTFGVDDAGQEGEPNAAAIVRLVRQIQEDDAARAVGALAAPQAALATGVTTVCDCGARGRAVHVIRDQIAAGVLTGPRIVASGAPVSTPAGHCWWLGGCRIDRRSRVPGPGPARGRRRLRQGHDHQLEDDRRHRPHPGAVPDRHAHRHGRGALSRRDARIAGTPLQRKPGRLGVRTPSAANVRAS